jgi:hypothetical protein
MAAPDGSAAADDGREARGSEEGHAGEGHRGGAQPLGEAAAAARGGAREEAAAPPCLAVTDPAVAPSW